MEKNQIGGYEGPEEDKGFLEKAADLLKINKDTVPITWKDDSITYHHQGNEYTNEEDVPTGPHWKGIDKAGEFAGNLIQSSPTLRTVLPAAGKVLSKIPPLPGEEKFANLVGDSAEMLGVDRRVGEAAGYLAFPGPGEIRLTGKGLNNIVETVFDSKSYGKKLITTNGSILRNSDGVVDNTAFAVKGTSGSQQGWKSKRVAKVGFDPIELEVFEQAALDYRIGRKGEGKKQLMKDFTFQGNTPIIKNKSGQEFMMVRKKKVVNTKEPWASENYTLVSVWEIQDRLATNANWTKTAKDIKQLKASLNRLRLNHPDQFYHVLMEYGNKAYLEHKVAKKQPWFWNRREADSNFASWLDPSITRNHEGNIRLLFRNSYKELKDVTESKIRAINKGISDDNFKYIIDLEDPIGGDVAKRSNPGNLLIREANSGDLIGIIPDYLQELFTDTFINNFNNSKMKGILSKPDIPEFYRIQPGETLNAYRSRILDDRIELIRNRAGQYSKTGMTGHINKDLVDFYELFDNKLGWLKAPTYITDQGLYN